jgi:S-formylglutathione hydrolase FrmB
MRKKDFLRPAILILCIAFALIGCEPKTSPAPPDHPRLTPNVALRDVTFRSAALNRDMPYRIILPATVPSGKKLPVLYLLHGGGGGFRDWSQDSDVARFAEHGLILVMPEGASSYYTNAADRPQDRYEDYISNDLIVEVEKQFPAAPGRANRAIMGISMGGFGAVNLALKHPDLFIFAAGLSSALDVPSRPLSIKRIQQYRQHAAIFGPWKSEHRRANDPFVLARSADPSRTPYLYLACGDQEGLLPANRQFAALLKDHHIPSEFHSGPGGHDWNQWNRRLDDVFQSLFDHMQSSARLTSRLSSPSTGGTCG